MNTSEQKNQNLSLKTNSSKKSFTFKKLLYIPKLLTRNEKKLALLLIVMIALASVFFWVNEAGYKVNTIPVDGGHYTEAAVGEPEYINPILSQIKDVDQDISSLIFAGLLTYNKNHELTPSIAERYEISEDKKNYTFFLRKDVKWSDGTPLTADDVVFTIQMIKNPEVKSPLFSSFNSVAVEKLDDYTVKFTLTKDVYSPFLYENATFGILAKHIWSEITPDALPLSELNLKPIGTGPYKFKEYKKDKKNGALLSYTLERNPDYFGEKPRIEYITFTFFNDWDMALEAYRKGDVLGISFIPEESKDLITDDFEKDINYYHLKLPRYYALFFNWSENPVLKERNVRRAIAHTIDQERIINEALDGEAYPVNTAILPNFMGHNPEIGAYEYNHDKAKEELEKAGWKVHEEDGMRYKDNQKLEFTLAVTDKQHFIDIAEIMSEDLAAVGITMNIESLDAQTLQTEYIMPRSYDALLYGQLLLHDPDPYPFWHSSARKEPGLNLTSYNNPTIDDLLETARKETDENERVRKYLHFQNIMGEELPAIFLYSPTYLYSMSKKVHGAELEYITLPPDRFAEIQSWYIKTKPVIVKE
ncbi:hypothetical protein KKH43_01380 [Patescibacteria group bacterium]|nr:hypothetical protein [Patescibacteria group bacterium]